LFMKKTNKLYASHGFTTQINNMIVRPVSSGYQDVQFQLKDYNNLSSSMEYGVRFDEIEQLYDGINASIPIELRGKDFDLQIQYSPTISASWNALVGNVEWTFDAIDNLEDVESLVFRWHKRYQDTGEAFFSEFSSCDEIVNMHLNNSPRLSRLFYGVESRIRFSGIMFLFAKRGKAAAIEYARTYRDHLQGNSLLNIERVIGRFKMD